MTEYTFCRICRVPRYVEGFTLQAAYLEIGWVKELFQRIDNTGEFFIRVEWLCPDCRQAELADERDRETARRMMIEKSNANHPSLYERFNEGHRGERSDD